MRRNNKSMDKYFFPMVEQILKDLPSRYMDMNTRVRVYKFIKRKKKQLFQAKEQIFSELIFILRRKRKKPFWRTTSFERFLRKKQLLCQYYRNVTLKWLKATVRKNKYFLASNSFNNFKSKKVDIMLYQTLENRLDSVLYRTGLFPSFLSIRQFISHRNISVNGKKIYSSGYILKLGDFISFDNNAVFKHIYTKKIGGSIELLIELIKDTGFLKKTNISSLLLTIYDNHMHNKEILKNIIENQDTNSSKKEHFTMVENFFLYQTFLSKTKKNDDMFVFNLQNKICIVNANKLEKITYPFDFTKEDFRNIITYLNK